MEILHKICQLCQNKFQTWEEDRNFCSTDCFDSYIQSREIIPKEDNPKFSHIELWLESECNHCGENMKNKETISNKTFAGKFCSEECRKARSHYNKKNKYTKTCIECGYKFVNKIPNIQFCSESCRKGKQKTEIINKREALRIVS